MTATIDLTQFCCDGRCRFDLSTPFVQNGFLCATDGAILITMPTDEPDTEGRKLPKDVAAYLKALEGDDWRPWPAAEYVDGIGICPACEGTGAAHHRKCNECDGEGEIDCDHCGNSYECDECHGEGDVLCGTCLKCEGKKEIVQPKYIALNAATAVACKYDKAIRTLPNVEYRIHGDMVFLKFDGGCGAVMRLSL